MTSAVFCLLFAVCFQRLHSEECMKSEITVTVFQDDSTGIPISKLIPLSDATRKYKSLYFNKTHLPVLCRNLFENCPDIEYLWMEEVGLSKIEPQALDNLASLKYLSLTSNKLEKIEFSFSALKNAKSIVLEENAISSIVPSAFDDLPNLEIVQLSNNKIREIQRWFKNSPKLKHIGLSYNLLTEIPAAKFADINTNVPLTISLSGNKIEKLHPAAFQNIMHFESLILDENKLEEIPDGFLENLKSGKMLDLSDNKLKCIPEYLLGKFKIIRVIENPLVANCVLLNESVVKRYNASVQIHYNEIAT